MQWIGMLLPVLYHGKEVERVAAVPYDHHDGPNQLLALHRSANVLRLCIVTAESKPAAETEARHVFHRRSQAAKMVTFQVPSMDREAGTLYSIIYDAVDAAMRRAGGVQKQAAIELGITPRMLNYLLGRMDMNCWRPMILRRDGLKVAR